MKNSTNADVVGRQLSPHAIISARAVWERELTTHLQSVFVLWSERNKLQVRNRKRFAKQSVKEIVAGVKFCRAQQIPVIKTTLSRTFNIGSSCSCLLAKGVGSDYYTALSELEISEWFASCIGCSYASRFDDIKYFENARISWGDCYNHLWRAVGKFFKANPKFGVS